MAVEAGGKRRLPRLQRASTLTAQVTCRHAPARLAEFRWRARCPWPSSSYEGLRASTLAWLRQSWRAPDPHANLLFIRGSLARHWVHQMLRQAKSLTRLATKQISALALFNLAIDSKLRGCDVVAVRVEDVAPNGYTMDRATVREASEDQPGHHKPKSPLPGNRILSTETKRPKRLRKFRDAVAEKNPR